MKKFFLGLLFFLLAVFIAMPCRAGEPMKQVKDASDKIILILKDSGKKDKEKKRLMGEIIDKHFCWPEMSRRTLASYWQKRTEEEKREFTSLFARLIKKNYTKRVCGNYLDQVIDYKKEKIKEPYALVATEIVKAKASKILVSYRLKKIEERWLIYDIYIDGVSLVKNYRSQFKSILAKKSFKHLIKKIKKRIAQIDASKDKKSSK